MRIVTIFSPHPPPDEDIALAKSKNSKIPGVTNTIYIYIYRRQKISQSHTLARVTTTQPLIPKVIRGEHTVATSMGELVSSRCAANFVGLARYCEFF